jgi:hypothetical protein
MRSVADHVLKSVRENRELRRCPAGLLVHGIGISSRAGKDLKDCASACLHTSALPALAPDGRPVGAAAGEPPDRGKREDLIDARSGSRLDAPTAHNHFEEIA